MHFSRAEIFYSTWSLSERPGVGRVRASQSHWCCTPFVPTAHQTDCRTCHCGYWLACLLFCSISSGGGRVSVPAALSFLLQHRDSQAQRKICWSSSISSVGAASSQYVVGRDRTSSKLHMWLAGLSKCQVHEPARMSFQGPAFPFGPALLFWAVP